MPNWCDNRLTVFGDDNIVKDFMFKARGSVQDYKATEFELRFFNEKQVECGKRIHVEDFSFHQLCPIPDQIMEQEYDPAGYDCEKRLWGVKWGGSDSKLISYKDGSVNYEFQTPWGPAEKFFIHVVKNWKDLKFALSWREECPTRGKLLFKNGLLIERIYDQYPFDSGTRNLYYNKHNAWVKNLMKNNGLDLDSEPCGMVKDNSI
jgi:hypothetical protein